LATRAAGADTDIQSAVGGAFYRNRMTAFGGKADMAFRAAQVR
jgi:hypothetical protein